MGAAHRAAKDGDICAKPSGYRALYVADAGVKRVEERPDAIAKWPLAKDLKFPDAIANRVGTDDEKHEAREEIDLGQDRVEFLYEASFAERHEQGEHGGEQAHTEAVAEERSEARGETTAAGAGVDAARVDSGDEQAKGAGERCRGVRHAE